MELEIGEVKVKFQNGFAYCWRNAGECYGGVRKLIVDCRGIDHENIAEHIREYAGDIYADYLNN